MIRVTLFIFVDGTKSYVRYSKGSCSDQEETKKVLPYVPIRIIGDIVGVQIGITNVVPSKI